MSTIVVQEFLTLDGVIQGPGGVDEDRDGGFELGGWQDGYDLGGLIGDWESKTDALLLGRRTYEIWASYWPFADEDDDGPFGDMIRRYNRVPKYVASRALTDVSWNNARLLGDDVPGAVAKLREEPGGEIRVWGSADLIATLAAHDLVDEYRLMQYPIVLGTGKKLFPTGFPATALELVESHALPAGVVVSIYRRAGA